MRFEWDERKARENKGKHGITFSLAQNALESGLALYAEDQLVDDEWRMIMLAPVGPFLVLHVTITLRDEDEDEYADGTSPTEEEAGSWNADNAVLRIISARQADEKEHSRYFESTYLEDGSQSGR